MLPPVACAVALGGGRLCCGAAWPVPASLWLFAPLCVGGLLYALDWLPGRVKCTADAVGRARRLRVDDRRRRRDPPAVRRALAGGWSGGRIRRALSRRRSPRLLSAAGGDAPVDRRLLRAADQPGILLLLGTDHALVLFHDRARARRSVPMRCRFLLFSLVSAYCLLAGFALADAANGTALLAAFADGRRRRGERLCPSGARLPDQDRRDRRSCVAARRLCGSRRRPVGHVVVRHQQGGDLRPVRRDLSRHPLGGWARTRPSDGLDRHADDRRRSR